MTFFLFRNSRLNCDTASSQVKNSVYEHFAVFNNTNLYETNIDKEFVSLYQTTCSQVRRKIRIANIAV